MISDETYELCLPILQDTTLEGDERTDKLEQLVRTELSLSGQALEDTVLNILWRFRDAASSSTRSPIVRHTIIRKSSPAPWQISRPQSGLASPTLSTASPTARPSRPGFRRAKSNGTNSFGSPRPSPGLAFASPVPHSPQLDSYQFSEPGDSQNDYGEYGSDNVDWLLNEDARSRPSSAGTGSLYEARTSRSPTLWAESQQTDMTPYDMLRSVLGDGRSDSEIESALAANGYDLSMTIMSLMASQKLDQQDENTPSQTAGEFLIGKSMISRQPNTVSQSKRGRSPIVCKYWLSQNGNCLRADCRFSHDLSNHICKFWVEGNCLAGDSCIFSHDPTLLFDRLNVEDGNPMIRVNQMQEHQNVQVQDLDAFPSLQTGIPNQSGSESYNYPASPLGSNPIAPRRTLDQRSSSINRLSASPRSNSSRPTSRHRSRDHSPFISSIKDTEAFPTLGAAGSKNTKKHHGKRGGHGHGYGNKENLQQISSLADVVRMSPSPAPESHRKGFGKNKSSSTSCENNAAAMAIPPPQRVPWLETGEAVNHAYMNARQDAIRHANARNKFLQSAAQAWNRNDARAAKALSLRGQSENDSMRKAHREAARILYHERNKNNLSTQELYVDLHGLHPEEAIEYLEQALLEHQHSSHPVYAITGTGHHSKAGKDKVGKAIRGWLNAWKYAFREFSVVGDNLGGILGINPSSFDESKMEDSEEQVKGEGKLRDTTEGKIRIIQRFPATKGEAG